MRPLVAHADWSKHAGKRWMAVAVPSGTGWDAMVELAGDLPTLLDRLRGRAGGAPVALGLDLPIGLPRAYAELHGRGAADFPAFLRGLEGGSAFFQVCRTMEEVGPARPFFPYNALGRPRRDDHAARLGIAFKDFSRQCDGKTLHRPAASVLFWTLGANQVGKAALSAWEHLLLPALAGPAPPALWPFEGGLMELVASRGTVIAETYPAEAMRQLGVAMGGSKRRQADRKALAPDLQRLLRSMPAQADDALARLIADGFGEADSGEDPFDALLGLLCMLQVVQGRHPDTVPAGPHVLRWEGWVLGQAA